MAEPEPSPSEPVTAAASSEVPEASTSGAPSGVTGETDGTGGNDGSSAGSASNGDRPAATAVKAAKAEKVDAVKAEPVDVHPPRWYEKLTYRVLRLLVLGLAKLWFRVEIVGAEKVPRTTPFVLAPVHRSNVDFLLVSLVRPGRMRYMGKASIWKYKWPGRFFNMLGAFPVHRGTADRASLRTCMQVIEYGEPLVMFPEGTRQSGPVVHEVFDGTAYVAARTGVPLVPLGIGGSEEAMPKGAKFIRPRKVALVVGDPIEMPRGDGSGRVPRRLIHELSDQLYRSVQDVFDEARRRAGTY
ncbi:MAG TPA: lysophospholipid acyltransferase family protein [Acidimicrobiales bacterium]